MVQRRRESRREREARERQETRASLAFYFGIILAAGQFIGFEFFRVPINYLVFGFAAFIIIAVTFGPFVAIEFLRAIRGISGADRKSPEEEGGEDADA